MKKSFAILIVIVMMLTFTNAFADEIDLDNYDNDGLIALYDAVQKELTKRGFQKSATLPQGKYIAGTDLPVGTYILKCKTDDYHHGIVWIASPTDDLENEYPSILYEHIGFNAEVRFHLSLEDGEILYLPFEATLTISTRIEFK